ncbi:hypothetical protein O6H91_10G098900 [Diphasiastrum complanatum]|nr:hypothetical protein O6H91_Y002900 [Diphasiastrum complanatum]KAJ7542267.1 hypothetical protein O6H91_10G098900 [Diphasiastrum complanatum]KAJ7542268.1 hypothetical protein O6H91_10G098900 [Diphasiastrum complanatum]
MATLKAPASTPSKKRAAAVNSQPFSTKKRKFMQKNEGAVSPNDRKNVHSGDAKSLKFSERKKSSSEQKPKHMCRVDGAVKNRKAKKELAEARKKKCKPNYDLAKESVRLWEKMRQRNLEHEERSSLASQTLKKMQGKLLEMAVSHVASRVLQSCIKYCKKAEREAVFDELRPQLIALARNTYACHLAQRLFDHASKEQLQQLISSLHGNVVMLLRHPSGSAVVEHAYQLANGAQKQELLSEFYSPEYRLFKGVLQKGKGRIGDVLAGESMSKRAAVLEHMAISLQPILEKGIVDHSIVHRALVEYLSICKKTMLQDVVQQLSGPLLVRMLHTKDGAKIGIVCVRHGSPKERKKIIKGMKGQVMKIAYDDNGHLVLLSILENVDDTKLVNEVIISEISKGLKDLALHKYGHRLLLHLLAPGVGRYFPGDTLKLLSSPVDLPQDCLENAGSQTDSMKNQNGSAIDEDVADDHHKVTEYDERREQEGVTKDDKKPLGGFSKKDPLIRRTQLLVDSGLAKNLTEVCVKYAGELLRSPFGKDIIYEVAMGGTDALMYQATKDVTLLQQAIADLAAVSRDSTAADQAEHVLQQYHSSRTIRRLVLNSQPSRMVPKSFSAQLWKRAIKGRCKMWAQGHSLKVVSAFRECADTNVRLEAESELMKLDLSSKM